MILEKTYHLDIGKLHTIYLIEVYLQLMMRIVINERNSRSVKNNERVPKINYRSRKEYSVKDVILEKRIIYNSSIMIVTYTIHNITNLQACYYMQLVEVRSIVQ